MKKILLLACISMAALLASADNYFTMGENDTLRINPFYLGFTITFPFMPTLTAALTSGAWS